MSEAKQKNISERLRLESGTDKSRASPVPNPAQGRPAREAVQKDTPSRDEWLISLCDELTAIDEEHDRLCKSGLDLECESPEAIALERLCERVAVRSKELMSTIFTTSATTPQGMAAKATIAAKLVSRDRDGMPLWRDRPLASLATDILAQAVTTQELDGELLAAATDFHKCTAEDRAFWEAVEQDRDDKRWEECNADDGIWARISEAQKQVCELPAKTPEGLRAKASVVEALILEHHGPQTEGFWNEEVVLAMSLVRDLVGVPT